MPASTRTWASSRAGGTTLSRWATWSCTSCGAPCRGRALRLLPKSRSTRRSARRRCPPPSRWACTFCAVSAAAGWVRPHGRAGLLIKTVHPAASLLCKGICVRKRMELEKAWLRSHVGCRQHTAHAVWIVGVAQMLCKGLPLEFVTYFQYCRSLRFDDKPDYSYLRKLFRDLFAREGAAQELLFHVCCCSPVKRLVAMRCTESHWQWLQQWVVAHVLRRLQVLWGRALRGVAAAGQRQPARTWRGPDELQGTSGTTCSTGPS